MPENIRDSGQPHSVYTYSLNPAVLIQEKLGIIEGLRDFSHPFKFVQNVYDFIETINEYRNQKMLINEWKRTEIKTIFNEQARAEFDQIWEGEVSLHIELDKISGEVVKESVSLSFEQRTELHEYYSIPNLIQLVPLEDSTLNGLLIKIGADIPEKYAYEKTDVMSLDTIGGCYEIMPENYQCTVCGRKGHEAWFDSQEELNSSYKLSDGYVVKSYYNKLKRLLFRELDKRWFILKANGVQMAREMSGSNMERIEKVPMSQGFKNE